MDQTQCDKVLLALSFWEYIKQLYGDMSNQASPLGRNEAGRLFGVSHVVDTWVFWVFLTKMHLCMSKA